jgi:peptidoglycan/LPS O-acetylase OafA/YrhL
MKSSSGAYYRGLDHLRAVGVLIVFVWHFMYGRHGEAVPFEGGVMWGPWVLFDEGQFGIALFMMTLSGYLFARLLDGKAILYRFFLRNRLLRLMPLVLFTLALSAVLVAARAGDLRAVYWYLLSLPAGLVDPGWKSRAWFFLVPLQF